MSVLKFPAFIPPPRRADRTLLPAALTALLAMVLLVQLLLPQPIDLPEAGVARPLRLAPLVVPGVVADPAIALRPLFAPRRQETVEPGVANVAAPLEGARAVGLISARGAVRLFIEAPDGRISRIGIGGVYRGWRLVRVTPEPMFVRGTETAALPITASVPPVAPAADEAPEEDPQ